MQAPSVVVALLCVGALPLVLPGREHDTLLDLVESGSVEKAAAVLAHWSSGDRVRAAYAVGLDFLMNPAYMTVLATASIWAGRTLSGRRYRTVGTVLAWLAWSVVATNVAENIGLFVALTSGPAGPWPFTVALTHYWASAVISVTVVFSAIGLVVRLRRATPPGTAAD